MASKDSFRRVRFLRGRFRTRRPRLGRLGTALRGAPPPVIRVVAALALIGAFIVALVLSDPDGEDASPPREETEESAQDARSTIERLLEQMSLERKVAQLMLVGFAGSDTGAAVFSTLENRDYGGLVIDARNYESPGQIADLADEAASVAREADHVAPWVMAPQEGGSFSALAGLPPAKPPAELDSPQEAGEEADQTAEALLEIGVTGVLAPVLDVAPFGGGPLGQRVFSDSPDEVTEYATATVRAFEKADIFAAAKHFPGLGAASQSTEEGPVNVGLTLEQLEERDLRPFVAAIEAGVPGIVIGPGLYAVDDFVTPASTSPTIATDLLRGQLGFEGVAIADDVSSPAVTATLAPSDAAVDAVRAGVDLVYVSGDEDGQRAVFRELLAAVREGSISRERLDEAVERTLAAKRRAGLLERSGEGSRGAGGRGGSGR